MAAPKCTGKYTPCCNEPAIPFPGTGKACTHVETGEVNSQTISKGSKVEERAKDNYDTQDV